jgi:hypothetical protein
VQDGVSTGPLVVLSVLRVGFWNNPKCGLHRGAPDRVVTTT